MISQFFQFVCPSFPSLQRSLGFLLLTSVSAIAPLALHSHSAIAEVPGFTRPVSSRAELLQSFPRDTNAADLGNPVATSFRTYCGQEGDAPTQVITDRPLCDTAAYGGVDDIPVSATVNPSEPLWHNSPLQEPMVLQQSDKTQLFPR